MPHLYHRGAFTARDGNAPLEDDKGTQNMRVAEDAESLQHDVCSMVSQVTPKLPLRANSG